MCDLNPKPQPGIQQQKLDKRWEKYAFIGFANVYFQIHC